MKVVIMRVAQSS